MSLIALFRRWWGSDVEEGGYRAQLDRFAAEAEMIRHGPARHPEPALGLTAKVIKPNRKTLSLVKRRTG